MQVTLSPRGNLRFPDFGELWRYRSLVVMLVKSEVYGKYRQSVLGFTWAFIPPLLQMAIFTLLFGRVANLGPSDVPYPLFSYAALVPWTYFARSLSAAGESLVAGRALISKVYFPRLVMPLTGVLAGCVDLAISLGILLGMMAYFEGNLRYQLLALPVFVLIAMLTAFAVGLWVTALGVRYRDFQFVMPFFIQLWMFGTPVIYAVEKLPSAWRTMVWLNPMTGVVEGFRWASQGGPQPEWSLMATSLAAVVVLLATGLVYFDRTERTLADVI